MIEVVHEEAQLAGVTYEAMRTGLKAAIDHGSTYLRAAGRGEWEDITVHPDDLSDVQLFYSMFVLNGTEGGGSRQVRANVRRFEGIFRRQGALKRYVLLDLGPPDIQVGDKLALRMDTGNIGASLKIQWFATGSEALDLLGDSFQTSPDLLK